MEHTAQRCPDCSAPLPPQARGCFRCGLPLSGPAAADLWNIDQAIAASEQQHRALLARRQSVLEALRRQRPAVITLLPFAAGTAPAASTGVAPPSGAFPPAPYTGFPPPGSIAPRPAPRESSSQSVQGLLLALGGLLLAVAAVVFTVVAWGRFGVAGRALILLAFTAVALGLPAWLVRRRLTATAETIALLGLVLMCMDAYAAYRVGAFGLDQVDGWGYAAAATALIAAVAMSYPAAVPVGLIRLAGLFVAQLPAPLAVGALPRVTPTGTALAATIVIALNLAVAAVTRGRAGHTPERIIAWILAGVATVYAVPVAAIMMFADDPARPAAVLALAGLLIIAAAVPAGRGAGRALLAGFGILQVGTAAVGLALPNLGDAGALAPAVAALLIALFTLVLSKDWLRGAAGAAWVLLAAAGLAVLAPVVLALAGPFLWLRRPWTGAPSGARAAVSPHMAWSHSPSVLATVIVITVTAAVLGSLLAGRRAVVIASHGGLLLAAAIAPLALDSTRVAALATQGAVAGLCCLFAALLQRGLRSWASGAAGLGLLLITLAGALAERG
ncbi:MAG: hypothetical protein M3O55_03075, partial [Actinomycetota bacterium]|nr:hypothetical protein [Actinomycetota bacterium]